MCWIGPNPGLVYFEKEQSAYNALNVIIDNNIEI